MRELAILLKSTLDPATAARVVREEVARLDSTLPVDRVQTLDERLSAGMAGRRFVMTVLAMVGEGVKVMALGAALGLPLALLSSRAMASLLYGVQSVEARLLLAVLAILGVVGTVASWRPALAVTRVDPILSLKAE